MNRLFAVVWIMLLSGCARHAEKVFFTCPAPPNYSREVSKDAILNNMELASKLIVYTDIDISKIIYFNPGDDYISYFHKCNTTLFLAAKNVIEPQLNEYKQQTENKQEADSMTAMYSKWLYMMDLTRIPRTPFKYNNIQDSILQRTFN